MKRRIILFLIATCAPAQIVTSGLVAKYAMTDASGTTLPDSSGNSNNGTLANNPSIGSLGIAFNGTSQYAPLPSGLSTTVQTIQIFTDCDRYLNAGNIANILGNTSATGLTISCGSTGNGVTSTGLNKFIGVNMNTTLVGNISSTATTITVVSSERMPAGAYFAIDSETILCSSLTGNVYSSCARGQIGTTAAAHPSGAGVFGLAIGNPPTSALDSYFNLISPSMFTMVLGTSNSRMLDNGVETLYGGFYSTPTPAMPFTIANNTGTWQLGGNTGQFFAGTIYYVLMYTTQLTTAQIQQNVTAVQSIMTARGVPARTDGSHAHSLLDCEGTSIDEFGTPGWCLGMVLTGSPQVLVMAQPGVTYGDGVTSGILDYTVARDGPLPNPPAARNIITLGAPTNDFVTSTLSQVETYYTNTITSVLAQGWNQVYCSYMLSRTGNAVGFGGTYDAAKNAWNTWLQANYASIGCLAVIPWDSRFTADGAFANPNPTACGGTTCFSGDGVHPDQAGFAAMSLLAAPIINGSAPMRIAVVGSTQTQIVVQYTAPSTAACAIAATDNNGGPAVADLNTAIFTNANLDLDRTVPNGYRWPTLVSGFQRTVVIGTHDQIKKGTDGKSYSTALQTNTDHTVTITCNGGANTGTVHAQTQNVPYGSYYPELPIPDPTQVTYGVQPTVNWTNQSVQYIDPITGVLMQRVTGPADSFDATSYSMIFATPVIDVNGSAWSNPANFTTSQISSTLATTTTVNAPIFAPFDPSFLPFCCGISFTDFQVTPYGSASSGSVSGAICPSLDSGQSCASAGPVSVTFATSAQAYSAIPSGYPSGYFSAWGGMNTWFGSEDLSNRTFAGVNCSGTPTVCTIAAPSGVVGFNLTRTAGTSFYISGCSAGTSARFTIATVDNWAQITTQQNAGGVWTGCTYRDLGAGIRAVLAGSGTLNLSITGAGAASVGGTSGSNGARWAGGLSPVTDIATDCNGNTRSPAISGYLVGLVGQGVYLIQSDGTTCVQSNLYNHTYNVHGQALSGVVIPFLNDRCFLLPDYQNPQHVWKACHVANNYQAITSSYPSSNTVDNFTWTDLGTIASGIGAQVTAAGGTMGTAYASGLFTLGLDTVGDNGSGSGIIQYRLGTGGNDTACGLVWADANNNLISSIALWGTYPVGWAACHFGGELAAGYSLYSAQAESSQLSPIFFSSTVVAGGPFVSRSSEGIYKNGSLVTWSMAISSCTKASPAVCTSTANNLDNITGTSATQGAWIQIAGMTGSGWSGVNGPVFAHKIDNNTFSLYSDPAGVSPINSTGFGTLGGAITATMLPPLYSVQIASVVNNGGNARMVSNLSGGYNRYFPSGTLVMQDGDPIAITQNYLNSTTQYYAKVSSAPAGDFDVYNDSALTSPASYSALSGTAGWYATLAQTCPDPATLSLPGPQYMDTGIGTTGAGNQKVRCVKIRLHDEGCSDFPAAGEHALYPCASDSANVNRSSLHAWNVGDAIGDVSHLGNNHEILYVLAINRVSTNQIDVTLERSYGDDANYGWRGYFGCLSCDYYNAQHSPGWTPWAEAPIPGGLIQAASSPGFAIPPVNGSHNDFVPGITSGNVSQVSGYQGTSTGAIVPDSKINVRLGAFTGPFTELHASFPYWGVFGNSSTLFSFGSAAGQSYPSMRMLFGQAPNSEMNSTFSWNGDWAAMNGGFGNAQNNGDGTGLTRALTNVRGGTYDPSSTTSIVYLIPTSQPGSVSVKMAPVFVNNWPGGIFTDISGPSSLVTDVNMGSYCVTYIAGECRPNSLVGQVFVAMRNFSDAYGQCISNNSTLGFPCAFGLWAGGGWAGQVRNVPLDTQNAGFRRLTLGWTLPLSHYSFSNWISTPDAKWGLFAGNPIQQHPLKGSYTGTQWFAMKLPPSPDPDTTLRATFVPMRLSLTGTSGDTVRIAFGYAENGNPANFYCTSRAEACYTSASATGTNPFAFASETQAYTNCLVSCEVTIPAIPGRILYYVVNRVNGSNNTVSALSVVPVP